LFQRLRSIQAGIAYLPSELRELLETGPFFEFVRPPPEDTWEDQRGADKIAVACADHLQPQLTLLGGPPLEGWVTR
jgi:hypothetical protein